MSQAAEHIIDLTDRGLLTIKELDEAVFRASYSHPDYIYADAPVRVTKEQAEAWEREMAERVDADPGYLYGPAPRQPTAVSTIYGHPLEVVGSVVTIDEVHRWAGDWVRTHSAALTAAREDQCRRLAERKLRPRLRWLVDHPRLLAWVYRIVPSWRPTMPVAVASTAGSGQ